MLQVLDKKTVQRLGSTLNNGAASKPSEYAQKLMAKMGWKEGQGLGRNEDGINTHVTIAKRDDNLGLGLGKESGSDEAASNLAENWWHADFGAKLAAFGKSINKDKKKSKDKKSDKSSKKDKKEKKDKKDKKRKRDEEDGKEEVKESESIDYNALFKATGGARLGMRARRDQRGKIARTEGHEALVV